MNREIKNLVGFGFISAVAIWSANKGYKKGFSRGQRFERRKTTHNEKLEQLEQEIENSGPEIVRKTVQVKNKDFTDRFCKENTGR